MLLAAPSLVRVRALGRFHARARPVRRRPSPSYGAYGSGPGLPPHRRRRCPTPRDASQFRAGGFARTPSPCERDADPGMVAALPPATPAPHHRDRDGGQMGAPNRMVGGSHHARSHLTALPAAALSCWRRCSCLRWRCGPGERGLGSCPRHWRACGEGRGACAPRLCGEGPGALALACARACGASGGAAAPLLGKAYGSGADPAPLVCRSCCSWVLFRRVARPRRSSAPPESAAGAMFHKDPRRVRRRGEHEVSTGGYDNRLEWPLCLHALYWDSVQQNAASHCSTGIFHSRNAGISWYCLASGSPMLHRNRSRRAAVWQGTEPSQDVRSSSHRFPPKRRKACLHCLKADRTCACLHCRLPTVMLASAGHSAVQPRRGPHHNRLGLVGRRRRQLTGICSGASVGFQVAARGVCVST